MLEAGAVEAMARQRKEIVVNGCRVEGEFTDKVKLGVSRILGYGFELFVT